jgi:chloride channel protein, CIC family
MIKKVLMFYAISALLGILTGAIATLFQWAISEMDSALVLLFHFIEQKGWSVGLFSALISMLMIVAAWASVHYIAPEASGSGVPEIEGTLLHVRPIFWKRLLLVKFFSGILSLSAKMVMGREGPTIQIGGNLGKMLSDFFHLSLHRSDTLIAAGSAAGLAAAFNAPLAGVLFVMEEMRNQFNYSFISFKMVVICCVMATITMQFFMGSGPAINMQVFDLPSLHSLWLFLIFGVVVGFVGLLFNKVLMGAVNQLDKLTLRSKLLFVMLVGLLIGFLASYYPTSVGGGYLIINQALTMSPTFQVLCLLLVVRFVTTMLSYSTGVPGGFFAPMLALGTLLGLVFFYILNYLVVDLSIHPGMFAVAGMGALFAACVRSPITGVILVVEMTQNYSLILPLMITCITSTTVVQLARNEPIYTQLLRRTLKLNKTPKKLSSE